MWAALKDLLPILCSFTLLDLEVTLLAGEKTGSESGLLRDIGELDNNELIMF